MKIRTRAEILVVLLLIAKSKHGETKLRPFHVGILYSYQQRMKEEDEEKDEELRTVELCF